MTNPTPASPAEKQRTMYLHTLDGQPASVQRVGVVSRMRVLTGQRKAQLLPSIVDIRRERNECLDSLNPTDYSREFKRYGYVLVEVPNA